MRLRQLSSGAYRTSDGRFVLSQDEGAWKIAAGAEADRKALLVGDQSFPTLRDARSGLQSAYDWLDRPVELEAEYDRMIEALMTNEEE